MAIDKNTTLINNFSKGMNTDTSDAYLEDGSYRMAVNLRYTTSVGSNSGELHMIEGCTNLLDGIEGQIVKKATLLRDLGVIVTENTDGCAWHVYIIDGDTRYSVADIQRDEKNRVIGKNISIVCRYEDYDNQKLYIADGAGPIITVQLVVEHNPNVFENHGYIAETNINRMLAYPSAMLDIPKFSGLITGNLKSGVYQYAYQLYKKHAASSEISVATKMIPLHKGDPSYTDATQSEGYDKDVQTDKGIKIKIEVSDKLRETFDSIYIYRIHYKEVGQTPDIDLVYDEKLPDGDLDFSDTGIKSISVLSLEEYNSITGIHIIPSVLEAKDDFMFAANIDNDSPIYENEAIKRWQPVKDGIRYVDYEFVCADLVGDACITENDIPGEDKISIKSSGLSMTLHSAKQDRFIGELNDDNNTYANAYAQYTLKSLRRGETYRYGIILYDKDGNASAVKHIPGYNTTDIVVDDWEFDSDKTPFYRVGANGCLRVRPMGIKFTVNFPPEVKSEISKYEIVRCGRDYSDVSTIMQCVLSRPIKRMFEQNFSNPLENYNRPQGIYPLTPTGLVTTLDYMSYIATKYYHLLLPYITDAPLPEPTETAWALPFTNFATNVDVKSDRYYWDVNGNKSIFLIISPEYNYQSESVKDMLYNTELDILPIAYIYPNKKDLGNLKWTLNAEGGHDVRTEYIRKYYSIGNKYAHFPVSYDTITIDSSGGTLISYYYAEDDLSLFRNYELDLNNGDFNNDFIAKTANRHSYIKLYNAQNANKDSIKIKSVGFPDTLSWDDFASSEETYKLKYPSRVCSVGGENYVNWVANGAFGLDSQNESIDDSGEASYHYRIDLEHLDDTACIVGFMMGPGGKCFVAKLDSDELAENHGIMGDHYFGTYLCNIKKKCTPYGGDSDVAIENSTYRSFGDLFDKNDTTCYVFDGDCYILPFEYVSQHKWYHPYLHSCRNACVVYSIPMETNINIPYTCGYEFSKHIGDNGISNIQDQPANVNNIFVQDKPLYAYDTINNTVPTAKILIAESDEEDLYGTNMDYRVYHSEKKSNNERSDNWIRFKAADYIDVDNRYGAITGLRKFNNSLVFWQETGAGILQVNERAQITDDSNMPLILGTGGVLGRYDYINTKNGMRKGEFADAQSDNMLYWWDHDKKQILSYTSGAVAQELSKIKFILSLLNNCNDVNNPILFFDKQNNEAVFKVSSEGSIVFNENVGAFTGLYTIQPSGAIVLPTRLLLVSNDVTINTWNSLNETGVIGIDKDKLYPELTYVVNANSLLTKTFDNVEFGGRVYGGGESRTYVDDDPLNNITFDFYTPLKQHGQVNGSKIDNTEYNFRFAIPRADDAVWGGRLRGKTMEAKMSSKSNSYDFSLLFILTKYRISWA